jgi:tRNA threonylcarbamoyladenosine biosynthesis protein TsaB
MALILSIETSTKVCSVALHKNSELLGLKELFIGQSHSSYLTLLIRDLISYCDYKPNDLNAIAVSMGPGSYTGLRIGATAAKGLCYSLEIPLLAVNTLEAMAHHINHYNISSSLICPMIDARRMEVYCLVADQFLNIIEPTTAKIIDEKSFEEYLATQPIIFFGDGALKCKEILGSQKNAKFLENVFPTAASVGLLAEKKFQNQQFEEIAYFEPFYLKDFRITKPSKTGSE